MSNLPASPATPLLSPPSSTPSKTDVMLALALRQLATLSTWSSRLESLPKEKLEILASAVQTVPTLLSLIQSLGPSRNLQFSSAHSSGSAAASLETSSAFPPSSVSLIQVLTKWNLSPRNHMTSISTLFCAVCMLKDFGVLEASDFVELNFDACTSSAQQASDPLSSSSSSSNMGVIPLSSSTTPLTSTSSPLPLPLPLPSSSSLSSSSSSIVSALHLARTSSPVTGAHPLPWGASPLPGWSPVPSPLAFPTAFGSLSPLTFTTPASPLMMGSLGAGMGGGGLVVPSASSSSSSSAGSASNSSSSPEALAFSTGFTNVAALASLGHSLRPKPTLADPATGVPSPFATSSSSSPPTHTATSAASAALTNGNPNAHMVAILANRTTPSPTHHHHFVISQPMNSTASSSSSLSSSSSNSPFNAMQTYTNTTSPTSAASGFSPLLGGRSAFGILKRAAEEEAENDLPPKRRKLAE